MLSSCGNDCGGVPGPARARAEKLGRWLWPLFWLFIPTLIAGALSSEVLFDGEPQLMLAGTLLTAAARLAYCAILFVLGGALPLYRRAAILGAVAVAVGFVLPDSSSPFALSLYTVVAVADAYAAYCEFSAHAKALEGVDDVLAGKWKALFYVYLIPLLAAVFLLLLAALVSLLLFTLLALAILIAELVASILKLVYLYRTARIFRMLAQDL